MNRTIEGREFVKHIEVFRYKPDSNLAQMIFHLKNQPGALGDITAILSSNDMNILYCSAYAENGEGIADIIVEAIGSVDIREVMTSLQKLSCVYEVRIKQPKGGLIIDSSNYPIMLSSGQRGIVLRRELLTKMLHDTRHNLGSGGDVLVYQQGVTAGRIDGEWLVSILGKDTIARNIPYIVNVFDAFGWGRAELIEFQPEPLRGVIRLWDSFECTVRSDVAYSQFIRGFIAGITESIFSARTRCNETKCTAKGDECCEFEVLGEN